MDSELLYTIESIHQKRSLQLKNQIHSYDEGQNYTGLLTEMTVFFWLRRIYQMVTKGGVTLVHRC